MGATVVKDQNQSKKGDKRETELTESRQVMMTGVGNICNTDDLGIRLENALKRTNSVVKIVYGSSLDKVVVIFRDPVNPKFLERCFETQFLHYKFETIREPTVVQVLDIPKGTHYLMAVKVYLTNEGKSGGTKEADFYEKPDPACGYCLIDLKDPKVVHRVSKRPHEIGDKKIRIRILPYYEHLGIAVNLEERPTDLISDKLVLRGLDAGMLKFIREKMEIEFQNFTKTYRITLADENLNSLTFFPNVNENSSASDEPAGVVGLDWKTRVEKAFNREFLDQLHVEMLEIKDERKWKYLQETKEEFFSETPAVNLYEDSCPLTFKVVCRKTDEKVLKSLKVKIESVEPPEESMTDTVEGYRSVKLKAFELLGFKGDIESKTKVELRMFVTDGKIELIGLKMSIQKAKTEIAKIIASLEEKTCSLPNEDYLEILKSPQLIEQCNREIAKKNLRGIWEIISEGVSQKILICYEDIQKGTFKQIKDLIFGLIATDAIEIDGNMDVESLDGLRTEIRDIENSLVPFARITLLEDSNNVKITCRKDLMVGCKQQLQNFINVNLIYTSEIPMKAATANYIYAVMKSQIEHDLSEAFEKSPSWSFNDSKFFITGNQIVHSKCAEVLYKLASKVIVTWRPIERKGIHKYFASGADRNMESQLDKCHLKILGKDDFQKQKIRAITLTEEGQVLGIGVLDLYKQPVDGIVNEMNEDFEQFSRGGEELERDISDYIKANGKLTEEQVFITGPGKLPCLKILHAVAPKWRGGTENEDKKLEKTIEKILSTAESESLRSIAMPMVACRTMFGYPVKKASLILLETIIKHYHTRFKSIREIYICDTDSTKIQMFQRLAENMFKSQCFSIPLGQNLTFGQTIVQKPNKKLKEGIQTIVQRRGIRKIPLPAGRKIIIAWGDLAKLSLCTPPLKADIIVNPTTSFPDLSGDIANGLKAVASNGGKFDLESECKKKVPKGGLQKGSYVATETPNMSCDQILHLRIEGNWSTINEEILKGYIKSCMNYALLEGKRSIAFPTIGTGSVGYPRDAVARCFSHAISEFSHAQTSGSLEEVIIVIYHTDTETTMAFEQELQSLLAKRPHRLVANIEEEIMEEEREEEEKKEKGKISGSTYPDNPSPGSSSQLGTYPLQNGCSVTLKHGSLEDSGAAALVSPTSRIPKLNGVIPSAIKRAAGGTIIEDELQQKYGKGIKIGDLAMTGAGNIRGCNKVYHLQLEDYNSKKGSQASLIYNSVNTCLKQADKDGVSSIAFPTIGTGGFKWPPQLVADETFQAVKSYINSRPSSGPPLHIIIMIFSQNSPENSVFQTSAKNQFGLGGSSLKSFDPAASSDDDQAASATYLNMKVELLPGKLEESKADVIVSTTSSFPNLNGVIAKALGKVAGPSLQADCNKNYPKGLQEGQIASTCGGNLNCKKVFHIKLSEWNHSNGKSVVEGTVTECLKMLKSEGLHSIDFPTIGTGGFKYPAKDVASAMFASAKQFSQNNPGYHFHVTIVLFSPEKDVNQVFKDILSQTFHDVRKDVTVKKKKGVHFADTVHDDATVFSENPTNIDHEKRDFILLKLISDSVDKTNKAFQTIIKQVNHDFSGHEPLKNDVIGKMRLSDIQEIEIICGKLDVEVEVSKQANEIIFEGTSSNVRSANEQVLKILTTLNATLQSETVGKLVQQYYEWCYEETKHILIPYSKKIGIELEISFTKGDKTYEFTDTDDLKYCVDFSKYVESEVSNVSNTVKVVRLDRMMGDLQPLPDNWNQNDKNNLEVVTLKPADKDYSDVEANFRSTIGSFQLKMIHSIKSIQNRTIYQQYALKRRFMQNQYPNIAVEMTLWHGTPLDSVDKINLNGFNRSYAGQTFGKVWYGKGVYFSTQSKYGCDDNYTKRDAKGHKYIYQCKVLTGNSTVVTQGYSERYPPTDPITRMKFDSTSSPNLDEYVIYSDTQSYPEFLIEFE
ncbi:hypothetical protein CHS0354_024537 [Potamilus streckersoni]|uniref:Poly [ADP-ribose] polymerase n=1 Tax=Potamilus streckersoni TaxID=2493646 RepID=A0AAE0TLR6_9BIVA|nr:hypothetical protein CHS0354_024537 [Potamilus streckersoni]